MCQRIDTEWQAVCEPERSALLDGECGTLVKARAVEEGGSPKRNAGGGGIHGQIAYRHSLYMAEKEWIT